MRSEQPKVAPIAGAIPAKESGRSLAPPRRTRPFAAIWRFARNKPLGAVGGIIVLVLTFTALFASQLAPYDYDATE